MTCASRESPNRGIRVAAAVAIIMVSLLSGNINISDILERKGLASQLPNTIVLIILYADLSVIRKNDVT